MPLFPKRASEQFYVAPHAVQFVAVRPDAARPVQPMTAMETALIDGDVAAIRGLLRAGSDPGQVQEACLRLAERSGAQGQQCARLIQTAGRVKRLLPALPSIDHPAPVPAPENTRASNPLARLQARFTMPKDQAPIETALRNLDIDAASRALKKTRVPFLKYREKHQDQLTGILALGSTERIKLWNGLLVMRSARARLPDGPLKDATKSTLYYSQKAGRNQFRNLNGRVTFADGSKEKIVCRHLTLHWLKERAFDADGKGAYRVLGNRELMKEAFTGRPDLEQQFYRVRAYSREAHVTTCGDFGALLSVQFEKMRDASPANKAKTLLVNTHRHAMGAQLKIKQAADGSPVYVVNFYDPNNTTSHHRIRTSDLNDIGKLAITDFVHPGFSRVRTYQADALVQVFTMPEKRDFDSPPLTYDEVNALHKAGAPIPVDQPETLHQLLFKEKFVAHLQGAFDQIAKEPDIERQLRVLEARDRPGGTPGLFHALRNSPAVVEAYLAGILALPALSADQKIRVLGCGVNGAPPLAQAIKFEAQSISNNEGENAIAVFINTVASSATLSSAQKMRLLSGMDAQGTPILTQLDNQVADTVDQLARSESDYPASYVDTLRASHGAAKRRYVELISSAPGLTPDEKRTLLAPCGPAATERLPVS